MTRSPHLKIAGVATVAMLLAIAVVDRPLALAIAPIAGAARRLISPVVTVLEWVTLLTLTKFALGFVFLVVGLVLAWRPATRDVGRFLGVVGGVHMVSRLVAGVLKPPFGRLRPYEMLESMSREDRWFADGASFPSGHAVHFWALLFPIAWRWPRTRVPLLVAALFVSFSRIIVNDHYLGDVLGSVAIAALVSAGFLTWWEKRLKS